MKGYALFKVNEDGHSKKHCICSLSGYDVENTPRELLEENISIVGLLVEDFHGSKIMTNTQQSERAVIVAGAVGWMVHNGTETIEEGDLVMLRAPDYDEKNGSLKPNSGYNENDRRYWEGGKGGYWNKISPTGFLGLVVCPYREKKVKLTSYDDMKESHKISDVTDFEKYSKDLTSIFEKQPNDIQKLLILNHENLRFQLLDGGKGSTTLQDKFGPLLKSLFENITESISNSSKQQSHKVYSEGSHLIVGRAIFTAKPGEYLNIDWFRK
jgi:hypothetical protein